MELVALMEREDAAGEEVWSLDGLKDIGYADVLRRSREAVASLSSAVRPEDAVMGELSEYLGEEHLGQVASFSHLTERENSAPRLPSEVGKGEQTVLAFSGDVHCEGPSRVLTGR
ncbi:MAG TPA: hypothetical protein VNP04_01030 [Alphaproteobacteria bacterium]|jgi:hypothetical protein|nr:hypothetical protein [Alphaproteobacteria bacterium]